MPEPGRPELPHGRRSRIGPRRRRGAYRGYHRNRRAL